MGTVDVYRITNELDGATLDALVVRLEGRGKHPRFAEMMCEYLDAMAIDSARSVLDLGCGTGVAARTIAGRPQFSGRVTGIDLSQHLISTATRLADEDGVGSKVEFRVGDSHGLEVDDGTFDAAVAHTLFSHLDDPQKALREIVRAVRPGGNVGIFDGDYASLTFATSDPLEGKAADEAIINAVVTNPRVMRQMPQLIREAGLKLIAAFPYIVADLGRANFWEGAIKSFVTLLPQSWSDDRVPGRRMGRGNARAIGEGNVLRCFQFLWLHRAEAVTAGMAGLTRRGTGSRVLRRVVQPAGG